MENIVFMGCSSRDAISDEYKELSTNISKIFIKLKFQKFEWFFDWNFRKFPNNNKKLFINIQTIW